jgi:nitrite reductase (NADH) small subunit
MPFVRAAKTNAVPPGTVAELDAGGTVVAVANVDGKFCAFNGVCAHEGGPLGQGEIEGAIVTCPWHAWQYDVTTGKLVGNPDIGVEVYRVEVRGDDIFIDIG